MGGKVLELKVDVAHDKGREEGRKEGREEGRKEGREEGREEGRDEVISRLLKFGMSVNEVSVAAGYSTEEILKVQSKI